LLIEVFMAKVESIFIFHPVFDQGRKQVLSFGNSCSFGCCSRQGFKKHTSNGSHDDRNYINAKMVLTTGFCATKAFNFDH